MKFLFLILQEMLIGPSSSSSCQLKCSWKIFNWDDSIATVISSGHSSGSATVNEAFDGNNGMDSILSQPKQDLRIEILRRHKMA